MAVVAVAAAVGAVVVAGLALLVPTAQNTRCVWQKTALQNNFPLI